jgi:hypothetical protein
MSTVLWLATGPYPSAWYASKFLGQTTRRNLLLHHGSNPPVVDRAMWRPTRISTLGHRAAMLAG